MRTNSILVDCIESYFLFPIIKFPFVQSYLETHEFRYTTGFFIKCDQDIDKSSEGKGLQYYLENNNLNTPFYDITQFNNLNQQTYFHHIYSICVKKYILNKPNIAIIPENLSLPLMYLFKMSGIVPILTYSDIVLNNYTNFTFTKTKKEIAFHKCLIDMELFAINIVKKIMDLIHDLLKLRNCCKILEHIYFALIECHNIFDVFKDDTQIRDIYHKYYGKLDSISFFGENYVVELSENLNKTNMYNFYGVSIFQSPSIQIMNIMFGIKTDIILNNRYYCYGIHHKLIDNIDNFVKNNQIIKMSLTNYIHKTEYNKCVNEYNILIKKFFTYFVN